MTIGDQLTTDLRFAQRKLKQTGHPINAATARARHAVKCVRDTAHTAIECRLGFFVPCIAMSAAHAGPMSMEKFDRFKRSRQLGRDRDALDNLSVFEQPPHTRWCRVLNELGALRS